MRDVPFPFPTSGSPALTGLRVLDLSMLTPGPFASQILADLGATVLKIERPPVGDLERSSMPAYFRAYNRGKFSLALNVKETADRQLFYKLAEECDVFIEGFRPGAAERMGAGFETIQALNPKVVYVSINGFGSGGPRRDDRGHDPEYQALSGALHFNRGSDGAPVYNSAGPFFDYAAAMYAVVAVLSELHRPDRQAVRIEVPIMSAGLAWIFPRLVDALESAQEIGASQPVYRCADGGYLTVAAVEENTWPPLCRALDRPDLLSRHDLAEWPGRLANMAELRAIMVEAIATRTRDEWMARFSAEQVPAAPILEAQEVLHEPHIQYLDVIRREPELHAALPINGVRTIRHVDAPDLDAHGDLVRAHGWAGLEEA